LPRAPRHVARRCKKAGRAGQRGPDHELAAQLQPARQAEAQAHWLARDIRTLVHWLRHDVLALAGPDLAMRQELFNFIVAELAARKPRDTRRIRPVRVALQNQRNDLLAFAGVLDDKLTDVARAHAIAEPLVREALVLHRLLSTSPAYWQGWNRLRAQTGGKFHTLFATVRRAMADTPRSSSLVENLHSRLRPYFTLRRHLGGSYLDLLQFFLNHRRFMRSRHAERQGKSPRKLMTGQGHPHWLTLLLVWTAPGGIGCARVRSVLISDKGDRPWTRLGRVLNWVFRFGAEFGSWVVGGYGADWCDAMAFVTTSGTAFAVCCRGGRVMSA